MDENKDLFDEESLEKSFNDALATFKDELGVSQSNESVSEDLTKSKDGKDTAKDDADDVEGESEEDEDDEDEEDMKKSIEDQLEEDYEASAILDVEPFLKSLVGGIDDRFSHLEKTMNAKIKELDIMIKSVGKMVVAGAELQKGSFDMVKQMGQTTVSPKGIPRLQKSRFALEDGAKPIEMSGVEILTKSQGWLAEHKIDLMEAGIIESRINKGYLCKSGDALDSKVMTLLKSE